MGQLTQNFQSIHCVSSVQILRVVHSCPIEHLGLASIFVSKEAA